MNIVIFATAWGPRSGGINAFNRDFTAGLASAARGSCKLFCAALNASEEDVADARREGVTLIAIQATHEDVFEPALVYNVRYALRQFHEIDRVDWWVGHDIVTGHAAASAAEQFGGCFSIINHMSYLDYQAIKHKNAEWAMAKSRSQKKLFSSTQVIMFSVGPLLRDSCQDLTGRTSVMLIPGFPEIRRMPGSKNSLQAITFGRLDRSMESIKQGRLAIAAFGAAIGVATRSQTPSILSTNPRLFVVGVNSEDRRHDEILSLAQEYAGRLVNVLPLPYDEDRDALFEQLTSSNLSLMLSWHEGFGLTGWESIAAEVPLVVGRQSGLYRLIDEVLGGAGTGCLQVVDIQGKYAAVGEEAFSDVDLQTVSAAIRQVVGNLDRHLRDATTLKTLLQQKLGCRWVDTGLAFLNVLFPRLHQEIPENPDPSPPKVGIPNTSSLPLRDGAASLIAAEHDDSELGWDINNTLFDREGLTKFLVHRDLETFDRRNLVLKATLSFGTFRGEFENLPFEMTVRQAWIAEHSDNWQLSATPFSNREYHQDIHYEGGQWSILPATGDVLSGNPLRREPFCSMEQARDGASQIKFYLKAFFYDICVNFPSYTNRLSSKKIGILRLVIQKNHCDYDKNYATLAEITLTRRD